MADAEAAALIAYVKACFAKSEGTFDITSGLLRTVWDFSASHSPDQSSIDAMLPFIGLDNLDLADIQTGSAGQASLAWASPAGPSHYRSVSSHLAQPVPIGLHDICRNKYRINDRLNL
jgi:hypothetical protein